MATNAPYGDGHRKGAARDTMLEMNVERRSLRVMVPRFTACKSEPTSETARPPPTEAANLIIEPVQRKQNC